MAKRRFLITAALPYSNGRLHVGHVAGAYLPADIMVRYLRSRGDDVRFICGSDDNGVAIEISARKEGTTPAELSGRYNKRQATDFEGLGIHFDIYGGTHQPRFVELHNQLSQEFFTTIHKNGHFVKRTTEQLYDVQAAKFLPDRYVNGACYHKMPDGKPCGNLAHWATSASSAATALTRSSWSTPSARSRRRRRRSARRHTGICNWKSSRACWPTGSVLFRWTGGRS